MADKVNSDLSCVDIWELGLEEGLPFLPEEKHEGGVAGGGVDGSEGHDVESILDTMRSDEAEFVAVAVANADLVEA